MRYNVLFMVKSRGSPSHTAHRFPAFARKQTQVEAPNSTATP
jgi:hypothetical protein